jgi:AraC-like DNA-binding protein
VITGLRAAKVDARLGALSTAERCAGAQEDPQRLQRWQLLWLMRGAGRWVHSSGDPIPLRPGTLVLARPGVDQQICWDDRHDSRYCRADFDIVGRPRLGDWQIKAVATESPVTGLLDYLDWLGTWHPVGWADRAADVIGLVVTMCAAGPLRHANADPAPPALLRDAIEYLQREWADGQLRAVRLAELAAAASVSTGHFARRFQDHFGVGAAEAVERLRLAHAADLLLHSTSSLTDIATQCGFADVYHFSRRFSVRYGIPPGRCRRDGAPIDIRAPLTEARLLGLAARVFPSRHIEQAANTSAPPPLRTGHTYGQVFTVPAGLFLTNVSFLLATYGSRHSGVTITLHRGRPGSRFECVATRQIRRMSDNTTESLHFTAQPSGPYYIELSAPHGTPTWWWHQGRDAALVGGGAYIDDALVPEANFIFSADAVRGEQQ